jgi:transposase/SAM-dependent methyltransferase
VYRRVFHLRVGERFLDVGCSFGLLPLLIAEHFPFLTEVIGLDIEVDPFPTVRAIAQEHHLHQVRFLQADLLADDVATLGSFGTVTAIHLLEHFTESEMYRVLTNLLQLTSHRLLLAVPYEPGEPEVASGHAQLFSRDKLEAVGQWCLHQLAGQGRTSYEECAGGLLLIERVTPTAVFTKVGPYDKINSCEHILTIYGSVSCTRLIRGHHTERSSQHCDDDSISRSGERAYATVPRNRRANITLLASLTLQGMREALILEGPADTIAFEIYIAQILAPSLQAGHMIIKDNLSCHTGETVRHAIEARGCQLLFLPSYSPDLSPIEEAFSKLKAFLRLVGARTPETLQEALAQALLTITAYDAHGWFRHCGYLPQKGREHLMVS